MKTLAVLLVAFPCVAFSADWVVSGLNMDYANGAGTAQAVAARFPIEGQNYEFSNASFDIRYGAGELVVERPLDNFSYGVETKVLEDVSSARVRNFSFEAVPGKVQFGIDSAELVKDGETSRLGKTTLSCQGGAVSPDPIDSCINYARFNLASMSAKNARGTEISDVKLGINAGKTTFEVKIGGIGKVNGEGTVSHLAADGTLAIRVSKVKYGFIDITGQFFSELEKNESETLRVERPFVYVQYKK